MPRAKLNNAQFNVRIDPKILKNTRKVAAQRDERLGVIIEEALIAYLKKLGIS